MPVSGRKTLKACLCFPKRQKLIRADDLDRLLEKCIAFDKTFGALRENCQILTQYYADTRYPDIWYYARFENGELAKETFSLIPEGREISVSDSGVNYRDYRESFRETKDSRPGERLCFWKKGRKFVIEFCREGGVVGGRICGLLLFIVLFLTRSLPRT